MKNSGRRVKETNDPVKNWAIDLNEEFSKEGIKMDKKYSKKSSSFFEILEMQIKITWDFITPQSQWLRARKHLTTNVGEAVGEGEPSFSIGETVGEREPSFPIGEAVGKGEPYFSYWWNCKLEQPLWKTA